MAAFYVCCECPEPDGTRIEADSMEEAVKKAAAHGWPGDPFKSFRYLARPAQGNVWRLFLVTVEREIVFHVKAE